MDYAYDVEPKLKSYYSSIIASVLINALISYFQSDISSTLEEVEEGISDCLLNGLSKLKGR